MLVLERQPVPQRPPVPLKAGQVLQLPLTSASVVSFGRGRDCIVRTDGSGVQATLVLDKQKNMTLRFLGKVPAPGAQTTKNAPHGLRVITNGSLTGGTQKLVSLATHETYALQTGDTIMFTLHSAPKSCFTVRDNSAAGKRAVEQLESEPSRKTSKKNEEVAY